MLGLPALKALENRAGFPFLSANVLDLTTNKAAFTPSLRFTVTGIDFLLIGITGDQLNKETYRQLKVRILSPLNKVNQILEQEWKPSPPDVVILLSNLGLRRTEKLLGDLDPRFTVQLVLLSGTRRLLLKPKWVNNTALLESGFSGKHLGRADLHIIDGSLNFAQTDRVFLERGNDVLKKLRKLNNSRRKAIRNFLRQRSEDECEATQKNRARNYDLFTEFRLKLPLVDTSNQQQNPSYLKYRAIPLRKSINEDVRTRDLLQDTLPNTPIVPCNL